MAARFVWFTDHLNAAQVGGRARTTSRFGCSSEAHQQAEAAAAASQTALDANRTRITVLEGEVERSRRRDLEALSAEKASCNER